MTRDDDENDDAAAEAEADATGSVVEGSDGAPVDEVTITPRRRVAGGLAAAGAGAISLALGSGMFVSPWVGTVAQDWFADVLGPMDWFKDVQGLTPPISLLESAIATAIPSSFLSEAVIDLALSPLRSIDWALTLPTNLIGDVYSGLLEGIDFEALTHVDGVDEIEILATAETVDLVVEDDSGEVTNAMLLERIDRLEAKIEAQGKVGVVRVFEIGLGVYAFYVALRDDLIPGVTALAAEHGPTVVAWYERITQQPQ